MPLAMWTDLKNSFSLTPWIKLMVAQLVKELPIFYGTPLHKLTSWPFPETSESSPQPTSLRFILILFSC
jgi:hypothetical protein